MPFVPLRQGSSGLFEYNLNQMLEELFSGMDITQAENVVKSTYGDTVSVKDKAKNLNKFGDHAAVGTSFTTLMPLQGAETNETFVSTNLIDGMSTAAAADTGISITIEGHTIDAAGNLSFAVQTVATDASDGRTEVALTTPLARATRAFVANSGTFDSPQAALAGALYIYDNTGGVAATGLPNTASATKLMILAGETQSEKCATAVSSTDYWFISYFSASIDDASPTANFVTCRIEVRDVANGGVWRPLGRDITVYKDQPGVHEQFSPYLIVPKNHDVRVRGKADIGSADVHAEVGGYLAVVV